MSKAVTYTHKNGYSARLYGETSMSIYFNGKEVMHTGARCVDTEEEVMELLENYPIVRSALSKHIDEILADDEEQAVYPSDMGVPLSNKPYISKEETQK